MSESTKNMNFVSSIVVKYMYVVTACKKRIITEIQLVLFKTYIKMFIPYDSFIC